MQPGKADAAYLWDMLTSAQAVRGFAAGATFEDYLRNAMMRRAIEREVEIIGEAAGRVSEAFKQAHPDIPWRAIVSQRHLLVHGYAQIRHDRLWTVVTRHIPELIEKLRALVLGPPPDPESDS